MLSTIELVGLRSIIDVFKKVDSGYHSDSNSLSSIDDLGEETETLFYYEFYSLWPSDIYIIDKLLDDADVDWLERGRLIKNQIQRWFKKEQEQRHLI